MLSLRTAMGLTQADLAERLGVSRKAIGRWDDVLVGRAERGVPDDA